MTKSITQKKIAAYTSRKLKGYNSIMAHDDNIMSFRFSAYGTLVLFNIMNSYYTNKQILQKRFQIALITNLGVETLL